MRIVFFILGWVSLFLRHWLSIGISSSDEEYFYFYDIFNSLSFVFFGIGFLLNYKKNTLERFIVDIAMSTFIDDLIDRVIFDVSSFQTNDIIVNVTLLVIATYRNKKILSKWTQRLLYRI